MQNSNHIIIMYNKLCFTYKIYEFVCVFNKILEKILSKHEVISILHISSRYQE